jgi:hypothetical protein
MTIGAPALKDKPGPEPTLIGEWIPESVTVNARPIQPGSDRWVFRADGTWAMSVDLSSVINSRPADLCRYWVDRDTMVLSVGHVQGERPADLHPARNATVWVFKRAQK